MNQVNMADSTMAKKMELWIAIDGIIWLEDYEGDDPEEFVLSKYQNNCLDWGVFEGIQDNRKNKELVLNAEDQEKGCVKCGVEPRHNQTDPDGSYLCLKCEEDEEESDAD